MKFRVVSLTISGFNDCTCSYPYHFNVDWNCWWQCCNEFCCWPATPGVRFKLMYTLYDDVLLYYYVLHL